MAIHGGILIVSSFTLALLIAHQQAGAFEVKDCTGGKQADANVLSSFVSSCPDQSGDSCQLKRGTNVTIKVDLQATSTFAEANMSIKAKIGGIYIPFIFSPTNACGNYGFDCPVEAGQKAQLVFTMPVLKTYPRIKAGIKFLISDEKKNPIMCVEFPAKIN